MSHIDGTVGEKKDFSALIKAAQVGLPAARQCWWAQLGTACLMPAAQHTCLALLERQPLPATLLCFLPANLAFAAPPLACLQEAPGFASEPEDQGEQPRTVTTGFARNAVLGVAGEVVKAVQEGHLKHIFLVGGCDGSGEGLGRYVVVLWPACCGAHRKLGPSCR